jgi:ornithine cyclodeaminase/alanine dehydrogenase-like protein (mu-crystallin family)
MELPLSVLERSYVCADFVAQCLLEGECQQIERDGIDVTLVELVQNPGAAASARERISVFDSTGWALQDHVAADLLVGEARRLGLGTRVEIEASSLRDPKNPYAFLGEGDDVEQLQPDLWGRSSRKRA